MTRAAAVSHRGSAHVPPHPFNRIKLAMKHIATAPKNAPVNDAGGSALDDADSSIDTNVPAANDGGVRTSCKSDSTRGEENDRLRRIIGPRLVLAREHAGLHQGEAARLLGQANPTQLALWEACRRLIPMSQLVRVADLYGVSEMFLLGKTSEPERDPARSLRAATVRGIRGLLDGLAVGLVDAIGAHARAVGPDVILARTVLSAGQALIDALGVLMRQPEFDETKGSAAVARLSSEFEVSLHETRRAIEKFDRLDLALRERVARAVAANDAELGSA